jgi:L-iditol 2-dehydrogenase
MKAGVVHGINDIVYEDIPTVEAGPGMIRVRVEYVGICGSDIPRVLQGKVHNFPSVLGHEFSGIVNQVGEGVTSFKIGDHIAGVPLVPCMECEDCKRGDFALCKNYSFIGSRQQGAMAEYVVLPESNAVLIDDSIPFDTAALFEPSTVALHAIYLNEYKNDGTVAILGGGNIGLFTLQWIKILGAKKVVVIGRNKTRLALSKKFGADETISTLDEDFEHQINVTTEGKGFDYIFETAGSVDMMKLAFTIAANKAKVCFVGTPTKELVFSVSEWENMNRKEFKLTGSWMSYSSPFPGREWTETAEQFKLGNLKFDDDMLYAKYPLSEIAEAFAQFLEPGKVKGKILIECK